MGCTPQLQLGWKAITIEGNSGTPFSDKYISCCCLFISSLHRHQYLPGPITPVAVKLSGIILKSIYHFFGLDFLIMQWTGVLESTLDYEVCFIFSHSDKISKFPQLLGGNHGNSCFLGSTLIFTPQAPPASCWYAPLRVMHSLICWKGLLQWDFGAGCWKNEQRSNPSQTARHDC